MITRRRLALAALAPAAIDLEAQSQPAYAGALEKFSNRIQAENFDSLAWTRKRYEEMPRRLRFNAGTAQAAATWQKRLRAKILDLIGGFPARVPLAAQSLETRDFPTYTRESLVFTSRPGLQVFGYLLVPKGKAKPMPVVISIPGHGRGVDDIVGIDAEGRDRTVKEPYAFDYALQIVENGMAALAIEPLAFGCRRDPAARKAGAGHSSCQPAAGAALLFGESMLSWRVWDVVRSVDYLETRSEFDPKRIGLMGISGGGTVTSFGAALETRISAAFISGYLNTFRDSILSLSHCIDNYVPGILQWCEQYDVASLIAPAHYSANLGKKTPYSPCRPSSTQSVK